MSDDVTETVLKVHYRRQITPKQYEVAEFSMDVEQTFPASLSPEEIMKSAERMATEVKVAVFDQLGLDYTQDEETRIVMEVFPGSQKVASLPRSAPVAAPDIRDTAQSVQETPLEPSQTRRGRTTATNPPATRRRARSTPAPVDQEQLTADLWESLVEHPENWFDNSQDKENPKAPDFRATNKSGIKSADGRFPAGLWLNTCPEDLVLPDAGYAND